MSAPSRRTFLTSSTLLAAAPGLHAAGDDTLKVGLIGCGGRGTGAALNALAADKNVKLVALADAFEDRLTECLDSLRKKPDVAAKVDVKPEARFVGFDGYKSVIERCDVVMVQANDYRGGRWSKPRLPEWSDMTYQMRNWYNFTWLSGDFNVEQHVHFLDVCAWIMKDQYPVRAMGMGGRTVLAGTEYGNIYDHFSVVYEYADGQRFISNTRQQPKTKGDMSAHALGTTGRAMLAERENGMWIKGKDNWQAGRPTNQMYQTEHDELFAAIRKGTPINNGEYMAKSTLLAVMGRMAAYTGQQITWEMALNSKEDLTPPGYDWGVKLPDPPVAIPGVTKFL